LFISKLSIIFVPKLIELSKPNIFFNRAKVKNDIDMLDKLLTVYSILNFEERDKLVKHERQVLLYYVKNGLTKESVDNICEDYGYKANYLYGVNKRLKDKGYLVKDENNQHKYHLNKELAYLRKKFIEDKSKMYIIEIETD